MSPEGKVSSVDLTNSDISPGDEDEEAEDSTPLNERARREAGGEGRESLPPSERREGVLSSETSEQAAGSSEQVGQDASGRRVSRPEVCCIQVCCCPCGLSPYVRNLGYTSNTSCNPYQKLLSERKSQRAQVGESTRSIQVWGLSSSRETPWRWACPLSAPSGTVTVSPGWPQRTQNAAREREESQ